MSWQLLIWNMFIWIITSVMIYMMSASLWWLILPALFTGTQNVAEIVKGLKEQDDEEEEYKIDDDTKAKMRALLEKVKRGQL